VRRDVTLRPETADDLPLLRALYASTRAEEMAAVPWDAAQKDAFLCMQLELQTQHYHRAYPDGSFQIVLVEGRPAGRLYVHRGETEIHIIDVSLLPEYRRRGIGTALLRELLDEAAASGRRVSLYVDRHNAASSLYERLGFRPVADDGVYLRLEWMGATVSAELTISDAPCAAHVASVRKTLNRVPGTAGA
jgi:ribosomal protein S18 acetylase RimI-like enzyme